MTSTPADGINAALLAALPDCRNVLELGCNDGRLGARYKELHPGARWTGVDFNERALALAAGRLDAALRLDLEAEPLSRAGDGFDLVVMGDVLEHLKRPDRVLDALHGVCTHDARAVMCMPNMSHASVLERFVFGVVMYDDAGLLDRTHLRMFSARSVYKMLLDCGWLPSAAGGYAVPHANERFVRGLVDAAAALGVAREIAEATVSTYQLIVSCTAIGAMPKPHAPPNLSVIARATNPVQLGLNLSRSPALLELEAEVLGVRDVESAASAFSLVTARVTTPWLMFCGQEVYLPRGSGSAIASLLETIDPNDAPSTVIGLAGVGIDAASKPYRAGLVVEGLQLFDGPEADRALSIEDYAVILHRDCPFALDPELGWEFWATDLCLQAARQSRFARVARIPVFCNASGDGAHNESLMIAGTYLAEKYPEMKTIVTRRWNVSRTALEPAAF